VQDPKPVPRRDLTLAGFVAAGCVVLALLAATYWLSLQQRRAAAWVSETHSVLRAIANTRAALVDIQNGHRGFTIEGSEQALQPYRDGVAAVERETAFLRAMLKDTAEQQANLRELQRILPRRLESAARLVQARRDGGLDAVRQILETGWPAVQMSALRATLQAMEGQQEQLLQQRLSTQERALRWFWGLAGTVSALLALALLVLYLQVRRRSADQQRMLESEERFRLMTSNVVEYAIVMLDLEARVCTWNAGAERILGYQEPEITAGTHFACFYGEQDVRAGLPNADLHVAMVRGHCATEGWRVRRDGSRFWATMVLNAVHGPDGALRGFCLVLRDLTKRRQAEECLRAEVAERVRIGAELERVNHSLEAVVAERTRELQRANAELEAARQRLQDLSARLIHSQEQERARVARELHDATGQALSVLRMHLLQVLHGSEAGPRVRDSLAIVDAAIAQIRDMALRLRPTMLDDLGLVDALEWLVQQHSKSCGWKVQLDLDDGCPRLQPEIETACFRIVQESLANAARHARAGRVALKMRVHGGQLEVTIEDDGAGFELEQVRSAQRRDRHFGILAMTERARLVGGSFAIHAAPGAGVRIEVTVPAIAPAAEALAA
jgi:PAS domain S-box-containing protein